VSISSTFYSSFFAHILVPKNFKPKTQLCNFGRQNIGAKCGRKMRAQNVVEIGSW
jgi:hypothetical protein